jgi:hypothetical protein
MQMVLELEMNRGKKVGEISRKWNRTRDERHENKERDSRQVKYIIQRVDGMNGKVLFPTASIPYMEYR